MDTHCSGRTTAVQSTHSTGRTTKGASIQPAPTAAATSAPASASQPAANPVIALDARGVTANALPALAHDENDAELEAELTMLMNSQKPAGAPACQMGVAEKAQLAEEAVAAAKAQLAAERQQKRQQKLTERTMSEPLAHWESDPAAHIEYAPGEQFDELRLAADSETFCRNSILLVPEFLSPDECRLLLDCTEQKAQLVGGSRKKIRMAVLDNGAMAHWESDPAAHIEYAPGEQFDELRLAADSETFCRNSILLVPEFLSPDECRLLLDCTEQKAQLVGGSRKKIRMAVLDNGAMGPGEPGGLGAEAEELWEQVMNERVLPMIGGIPGCEKLFGTDCQHSDIQYDGLEPCVNRYLEQGAFETHRDEQTMTVLCLLDDQGFEGGGTEFWAEVPGNENRLGTNPQALKCDPSLRLHPRPGVGVIFHGQVWHAGAPTIAGCRYLLVASFNKRE